MAARTSRAVIAAGGTGGHFYPGFVLGTALRERGWEPLFLVRRGDPACARLSEAELPFVELDLRGLPRSKPWQWPGFGLSLARSLGLAGRVLKAFRPGCVAGMGGYLSFPAAWAAWRLGVPCLLHESNAVLGLANRVCAPMAARVALGLPLAPEEGRLGGKYVLTGTPVRPELWTLADKREARLALGLDPELTAILVFGGSQGARGVNRLAPEALALLSRERPGAFQALHLAGAGDEAAVRAAYEGSGTKVQVMAYLSEMQLAYAAADLVLCRAGASTLAELAAVRRPAVLIPFPSAAANHQEKNARVFEAAGPAKVLLEPGLTGSALAGELKTLLPQAGADSGGLAAMAAAYSTLNLPAPQDAVEALVKAVEDLAREA